MQQVLPITTDWVIQSLVSGTVLPTQNHMAIGAAEPLLPLVRFGQHVFELGESVCFLQEKDTLAQIGQLTGFVCNKASGQPTHAKVSLWTSDAALSSCEVRKHVRLLSKAVKVPMASIHCKVLVLPAKRLPTALSCRWNVFYTEDIEDE